MIRRLPGPTAALGEGPTYDSATDSLWWFDIPGQRLFEHRFVDDRTELHDLPFMASALARIDERRQSYRRAATAKKGHFKRAAV